MTEGHLKEIKNYPSTRYQGSKRKILPWIYDIFKELQFNTALDAFGGTGSVSYLLKKMGKSVTYNDLMKFNYYTGLSLIKNQKVKLTKKDVEYLLTNKHNNAPKFIQTTFKDLYYLDKENVWLDNFINNIITWESSKSGEIEIKKAIAYHCLFQACLIKRPFNLFHRKNLHIRTNDVQRSFGNKTAWEKLFEHHFVDFVEETNSKIFNSKLKCNVLNKDVLDLTENYDLVYLDPPYLNKSGNNETSNYYKCYHFLEGIANYSNWPNLIDHSTTTKRLVDKNSTLSFSKDDLLKSFESLFSKFQKSTLVLSYKKNGSPSIEQLTRLMKKYKTTVYTRSMAYKYALNRGEEKSMREVLIIGV